MGKAKGGAFERKICKMLSLWLSEGESTDLFVRSSSSGARATITYQTSGTKLKSQASDIASTGDDQRGGAFTREFAIETKHYADINMLGFICGSKTGLGSFWEQVCKDGSIFDKKPLLIVRENGKCILMCINRSGYSFFKDLYGPLLPVICVFPGSDLYILKFEEFLNFADPKALLI